MTEHDPSEGGAARDLEKRAIATWLAFGPEELDEATDDPGSTFVDRVIAREEVEHPPLVALDPVVDMPPANAGGFGRIAWKAALGLVGAAAIAFGITKLPFAGSGDAAPDAKVAVDTQTLEERDTAGAVDAPKLPKAAREAPALPGDFDERIAGYLEDYGRHWGEAFRFHGSILVARDGKVLYSQGFGFADRAAKIENRPTTRFRLGFLSQQFTAVAILQLVESGQLGLDDRVSKYLPQYPRGHEITIRQLLSHTSGIPNYTDDAYFHTWKSQWHTTEQMIARFADRQLEFTPGTDFDPSNSGYYLLGAIIERVTGEAYGKYVANNIFEPLGMTMSTYGDVYGRSEQARGNVYNENEFLEPPEAIDMSTFGAAGGLVSTTRDLLRWDQGLYDGVLLTEESVEKLYAPVAEDLDYGWGWTVGEAFGQRMVSWPGLIDGFNGAVLRLTDDRTAIIVLANTEVVSCTQVAQDVGLMLYGEVPARRVEPREVAIAPGTYPKYLGTYQITPQTLERYAGRVDAAQLRYLSRVHIRQEGDRLYFDVPGYGDKWMHPRGHGKFFFKDIPQTTAEFTMGQYFRSATLTVYSQGAAFELKRSEAPSPSAKALAEPPDAQ